MPHRKFNKYFTFLLDEHRNLSMKDKQLELIYRNYDVLCCFRERNFLSVTDISELTDSLKDIARNKLSRLEKAKLISSTRVNRSKFYTSDVTDEFLDDFKHYTVCCFCGNNLGRQGGIVHQNVHRNPISKIFCTKRCMIEWVESIK